MGQFQVQTKADLPWKGSGGGGWVMNSGHRWGSTRVLYLSLQAAAGGHLQGWNLSNSPGLALSWPLSVPGIPQCHWLRLQAASSWQHLLNSHIRLGPRSALVPSSGVRGSLGKQTAAIRGHLQPRDPAASRAVTFDPLLLLESSHTAVSWQQLLCLQLNPENPLDSWDPVRQGFLMVVEEGTIPDPGRLQIKSFKTTASFSYSKPRLRINFGFWNQLRRC